MKGRGQETGAQGDKEKASAEKSRGGGGGEDEEGGSIPCWEQRFMWL